MKKSSLEKLKLYQMPKTAARQVNGGEAFKSCISSIGMTDYNNTGNPISEREYA